MQYITDKKKKKKKKTIPSIANVNKTDFKRKISEPLKAIFSPAPFISLFKYSAMNFKASVLVF